MIKAKLFFSEHLPMVDHLSRRLEDVSSEWKNDHVELKGNWVNLIKNIQYIRSYCITRGFELIRFEMDLQEDSENIEKSD